MRITVGHCEHVRKAPKRLNLNIEERYHELRSWTTFSSWSIQNARELHYKFYIDFLGLVTDKQFILSDDIFIVGELVQARWNDGKTYGAVVTELSGNLLYKLRFAVDGYLVETKEQLIEKKWAGVEVFFNNSITIIIVYYY